MEHEELHAEQPRAIQVTWKVRRGSPKSGHDFKPTFQERRAICVTAAGMIAYLMAGGKIKPEMKGVLLTTAKLKIDLPQHAGRAKEIVAALKDLIEETRKAKMPEYALFARTHFACSE